MTEEARIAPFCVRTAASVALLVGAVGLVQGQDSGIEGDDVEQIVHSEEAEVVLSLDMRTEFAFEADFGGGVGGGGVGTIESVSYGGKLGVLVPIGDRARLLLTGKAEITDYDITPAVGVGGTTAATIGTQFDTVAEYGFEGLYTRAIDAEWSFFVGGGIGVAAEGGASDAMIWNGIGGVAYQVNPKLRMGLGIGVYSRIEDDVRIVPIPQVHYAIDDRWSLESQGIGGKLDYQWNEELSMGILGQFDGSTFRINSDNTLAPDGAVTMTRFPVSYYIDYSGGEIGGGAGGSRVSIFAQVGMILEGTMEVLSSTGATLVDEEIDPGLFAAVGIRIQF